MDYFFKKMVLNLLFDKFGSNNDGYLNCHNILGNYYKLIKVKYFLNEIIGIYIYLMVLIHKSLNKVMFMSI
jgi:hypothetical protein